MQPINYIDRKTGKECVEQVYGAAFLRLLYGSGLDTQLFGQPLAHVLARIPLFSAFYGWLQNRKCSAKKVLPFIKTFGVDTSEFTQDPATFTSFNNFFTRHLKATARPIAEGANRAVIPADGRYLFYQNIKEADGFVVKGEKFDLATLLQDKQLASKYSEGAMAIARLCPTDYHRYHFPCDGIPSDTHFLNSVNPAAIKKNVKIFAENKRTVCVLDTAAFGKVLFMEIGATCVGAIHETYAAGKVCKKGDEKGYFSFGASSLILLFPPHTIRFDQDLLDASAKHVEIRCLMGESMGTVS